ncbi:hypothetical protein GW17_00046028 [Ensete ventricosum]|nr:hypothetical protein GW17_00046028 [Ensete ventricosum]
MGATPLWAGRGRCPCRPLRACRMRVLPLQPNRGRVPPLTSRSPLLAALVAYGRPYRGLSVVDCPCRGPSYGRSPLFPRCIWMERLKEVKRPHL